MDGGRQASLNRLAQAVRHHEHAIVLGEPGIGKTCVLRAFREHLSSAHFRVEYLAHVTLGRRDFYRQVCLVLGIEPKVTPAAMFEAAGGSTPLDFSRFGRWKAFSVRVIPRRLPDVNRMA